MRMKLNPCALPDVDEVGDHIGGTSHEEIRRVPQRKKPLAILMQQ